MKTTISLILAMVFLSAFTMQTEKLYIKTKDITGTAHKPITKETISVATMDYLEISLVKYPDPGKGDYFKAEKEIRDNYSKDKPINLQSISVVKDSKGTELRFYGSTEFLNYMSSRGYKMLDQKKEKYHTDYTFQKK